MHTKRQQAKGFLGGYSLVEVMVGFAILGITATGLVYTALQGLRSAHQNVMRTTAYATAAAAQSYSSGQNSTSTSTSTSHQPTKSASNQRVLPKALTSSQIQAAKAAAQREHTVRKAKALKEPLVVRWPSTPQAQLAWERYDVEFDSYTISETKLSTTKNALVSEPLVGYYPSDEPSPNAGLTLVNRVRSDLKVDYYTFRRDSFLPNIEVETMDAYIKALPDVFEGRLIQPIGLEEAKSDYGPSAADLNTRRVTYRLVEENDVSGERIITAVVTDYLLPFDEEWLVLRFTAPPRLYESAREPIESYLLNMHLADSDTELSSL
jgi:type II secretory pathway pseudopilin PulG|tara:strand:+ start:24194 stop:25159 length:966 start_codon:yes stop_codon:yes gene_type:complete